MTGILILHATVGTGHKTAALAVEKALKQQNVGPVRCEDALDYGSRIFKHLYVNSYLELSEEAPALWAYVYERSDKRETELTRELRTLLDRMGVNQLKGLIREFQPEAVICTHFLPLNLLAREKKAGRLTTPLYCVVTDYTGHIYWVDPYVDRYFVAIPETARMLQERGIAPYRIAVTGIPVNPIIAEARNAAQIRQSQGLGDGPVITLLGGGIQAERVRQMVIGLLARELSGTLVVVAGRNKELQAALADVTGSDKLPVQVLGFVDDLDSLIAASDLVITKAGGLIVSEILGRGRPLLVIDPIPGQEEWNADYVVSVGAGAQLRLPEMVPVAVENLLAHPERLVAMQLAAQQAGRPQAASAVAEAVMQNLGQ